MNKSMQALRSAGVSPWLDNITRDLLNGTLKTYIEDLSITGLTSNPSIFNHAITHSGLYDQPIIEKLRAGLSEEALFFDLAIEDLRRAADLFADIHRRTHGLDGWVSLEVSPTLAYDAASTLAAARQLHQQADRSNLFIKIPGTREGLPAVEEAIFAGIPVNVTLLFSAEQYQAAAEAYLRGIERRIEAGLPAEVGSVASVFISRWDKATMGQVSDELQNTLGIAVAECTYHAYRAFLDSPRVQRMMNVGVRPQRLLWASTGTKDARASDVLYIEGLISPYTINTMPEATLKAFADHGSAGPVLPADTRHADEVIAAFERAGVSCQALGAQLQREGTEAFVQSWNGLLAAIEAKSKTLDH